MRDSCLWLSPRLPKLARPTSLSHGATLNQDLGIIRDDTGQHQRCECLEGSGAGERLWLVRSRVEGHPVSSQSDVVAHVEGEGKVGDDLCSMLDVVTAIR